jgi:transposase InsO family protein
MTQDDVLFGYRLRLFALAAEIGVRPACRQMGVHHSTYYRWKPMVERHGLEILRPRERRRPVMANQLPAMVEERILAFSLGHAGLGPKRIAAQLARSEWGGLKVSANGVWKVLCRHGLNTRSKRLALVAGHRAPYEPPREPEPEPHVESTRPGELVGLDCFFVGHLHGTKGAVWQLTACDTYSSFAWAELIVCPQGNPTALQSSALARRVARELQAAGWRLERVLSDNGNEFRGRTFQRTIAKLDVTQTRIRAGRPQTNGHVEALHKTILDECWRPAFARYLYPRFTGLRRELERYLAFYNLDRVHHGRLTRGRIPADIVYGARKMEAR